MALLTNIRLGFKRLARNKRSSIFVNNIGAEEKSFITLTTLVNAMKLFFFINDTAGKISWSISPWQYFSA
jgi:hypothetical protein